MIKQVLIIYSLALFSYKTIYTQYENDEYKENLNATPNNSMNYKNNLTSENEAPMEEPEEDFLINDNETNNINSTNVYNNSQQVNNIPNYNNTQNNTYDQNTLQTLETESEQTTNQISDPEEEYITKQIIEPLPKKNLFAGVPPAPGKIKQVPLGETPEIYTVEKGDTLFDICEQLLDQGEYWPKLWAFNPQIKNPHFIFPNMKLKFYPGDKFTPPYLTVIQEDTVLPIIEEPIAASELVEDVNLPENTVQELVSEHSLQTIPEKTEEKLSNETIEVEVIGPEDVDELNSDDIIFSGKRYSKTSLFLQIPGFIYKDKIADDTLVVGGINKEHLSFKNNKIILKNSSQLSTGAKMSIMRPTSKIYNPITNDFIGYHYDFIGNVEILKNLNEDYSLAIVLDNNYAIMPGDIVSNYLATKKVINQLDLNSAGISDTNSVVVNLSYISSSNIKQSYAGAGDYLFLDNSLSKNLSVGMKLNIYQNPLQVSGDINIKPGINIMEIVGKIYILNVTDAGAAAYIYHSRQPIIIGSQTTLNQFSEN